MWGLGYRLWGLGLVRVSVLFTWLLVFRCGHGGAVSCAGWGDVSCAGWSPLARWDGMKVRLLTEQQTTNDDIVVVRRLVATSLSATWHLQTPPTVSFRCDVALFVLAVVVVGVGDGCEWRPLAMVTVVVVK